jgi:hypothetical protein
MQPVDITPNVGRGSDVTGTATATRMVLTFTAGPGDEIRIPDSEPFYGTGLEVFVYNQEYRCIDKMNKRSEHITKKAGKAAESCVKDNSPGSSTPCTAGLNSTKIDAAKSKLLADYVAYCVPVPAWGVNGGRCCENGSNDGAVCAASSPDCDVGGTCTEGACISAAAERAVRDLALDIFGGTAQIGVDDVHGCQRKVMKDAGRVLSTRWKTFRKCKKSSSTTITDDATLVGTCLGPPQVDGSGKILSKEMKLEINVQKNCVDDGVVPVGSAFPGGVCSAEADANFGACVNSRAACRFCLAVNVADDIVPALDCDAFDDGAVNGSCS